MNTQRTRPWGLTFNAGRVESRHMAGVRKRWSGEGSAKSMISLFRGGKVAKLGRMKEEAMLVGGDRVNHRFSSSNTGENLLLHRFSVTY